MTKKSRISFKYRSVLPVFFTPCALTFLIFGQLHRAVDVGRHLASGEAALLLVSAVRVVALWL